MRKAGKGTPESVLILGAGHFGARAAALLEGRGLPVLVVDRDLDRFSALGASVRLIRADAVDFLLEREKDFHPEQLLVPAVPFHVAFEWLRRSCQGSREVTQVPVPEAVKQGLPFTWPGSEGSLLVSCADFVCPDDCPEPAACTVTGERRQHPLWERFQGLRVPGVLVQTIRSRQLAPGLGGFRFKELLRVRGEFLAMEGGAGILGTACGCHGILTAFDLTGISGAA